MAGLAPPPRHTWTNVLLYSMEEALGGNGSGKAEPVSFHTSTPSLIQQRSLMSSVCNVVLKTQSSELAVHQNPWEEEGDKNISGP